MKCLLPLSARTTESSPATTVTCRTEANCYARARLPFETDSIHLQDHGESLRRCSIVVYIMQHALCPPCTELHARAFGVQSASSRRRDKEPRRQVSEDPRTIMINKAVSSWFPARRPRIEWARPAPLILCHLGYAHSLRPSGTVCVRRAQYIYCATAPCAREPTIYHGCSLPPAAGASALMQPESAMCASLYPFSGRSLKSLTLATASYTTTST
jgi:hypothetical protein